MNPYFGHPVHWGFEIRTSFNFEWSKRGWFADGLDLEWDLKSRKPNHFKLRQMAAILSKNILNPDKNVKILNGSVFKWLVGTIAIARPFENRNI